MHSDQFKPKLYLKLIKKYIFSECDKFPLSPLCLPYSPIGKYSLSGKYRVLKVSLSLPCLRAGLAFEGWPPGWPMPFLRVHGPARRPALKSQGLSNQGAIAIFRERATFKRDYTCSLEPAELFCSP